MPELFWIMLIWMVTFMVAFFLYYFISINYPEYNLINSIVVAILGFTLAYALGIYILGTGVIVIPLIF